MADDLNPADPKDLDAKLQAESARLLRDMNALMERGRLLLRDRQRATAAVKVQVVPGTLGAVLYAKPSQEVEAEGDWVSLVRSIAAGDELAVHALRERSRRPVATLIERLVGKGDEKLAREVYDDVSQRARYYDAATDNTVLAWVMNLARARALAGPSGRALKPLPAAPQWFEPPWQDVAPGISVKMLAMDAERHMVSMMVRLVPGGEYPAHSHAGVEELHLLEGELWIDDRKLHPGDYNRAEPGTGDKRVWSETGCACVLVTSTKDLLS